MDMAATAEGAWPTSNQTGFGFFRQTPGGKGANEAVAVARLGVKSSLVGCIGADATGSDLKKRLTENGVDTQNVRVVDSDVHGHGTHTGTAVQIMTMAPENGVKFTVICPDANAKVNEAEVDAVKALVQRPDVKLLLLQLEIPADAMTRAIRYVRRRNKSATTSVSVAFKASPLSSGSIDTRGNLGDAHRLLAAGIDLAFINETEAPTLLGWAHANSTVLHTLAQAEKASAEVLDRWPKLKAVVVTCSVGHIFRQRAGTSWLSLSCCANGKSSEGSSTPQLLPTRMTSKTSEGIAHPMALPSSRPRPHLHPHPSSSYLRPRAARRHNLDLPRSRRSSETRGRHGATSATS